METPDWAKNMPVSAIVSDENGKITYMNDYAIKNFEGDGGSALIGKNLFECHNDNSNRIIHEIMDNNKPNFYTIEKKGIKKLIYQMPLNENGKCTGLVELSLIISDDMPHFMR
jgi:transcriptional regulator with PAS, ATPase and Fis domain